MSDKFTIQETMNLANEFVTSTNKSLGLLCEPPLTHREQVIVGALFGVILQTALAGVGKEVETMSDDVRAELAWIVMAKR